MCKSILALLSGALLASIAAVPSQSAELGLVNGFPNPPPRGQYITPCGPSDPCSPITSSLGPSPGSSFNNLTNAVHPALPASSSH